MSIVSLPLSRSFFQSGMQILREIFCFEYFFRKIKLTSKKTLYKFKSLYKFLEYKITYFSFAFVLSTGHMRTAKHPNVACELQFQYSRQLFSVRKIQKIYIIKIISKVKRVAHPLFKSLTCFVDLIELGRGVERKDEVLLNCHSNYYLISSLIFHKLESLLLTSGRCLDGNIKMKSS